MKSCFFARALSSVTLTLALFGPGCATPPSDSIASLTYPGIPGGSEDSTEILATGNKKAAPEPQSKADVLASAPPALRERAFLVFQEGGARVILQKNPDAALRQGRPHLLSLKEETVVRHDVNQEALPPEFAQLRGQKMLLWGQSGIVCEGLVQRFSILNRVQPYYDVKETWEGTYSKKPWKASDIAMHAFSLSEQQEEILTADLLIDRGDCADALWASSASQPPRVARFQPADESLRAATLAQLRTLPAYKGVFGAGAAPWEKTVGITPQISFLRAAEGKELLVSFVLEKNGTFAPSFPGYGSTTGNFWALFEVKGWPESPVFTLRNNPAMPWGALPSTAVDRDNDGAWEILYDHGFLHQDNKLYQKIEKLGSSRVQPYPYREEEGGC